MTEQEQLIADQADLEAFARLPPSQRAVTDRLKGVLAETAVTGVIRYEWPLLQPVLVQVMQEQLAKYEAEEYVEIGPARPILGSTDDTVAALAERFSKLLSGFDSHPWTLQRLCELLLEPQKQYKRLHKLALAIEKLLLVTGELGVSEQPGPPPLLSQLTRINEAPPPPAGAAAASNAASRREADADGSGLVAAALHIRQQPQQPQQQANAAAPTAADPGPAAAADPAPAAAAAGDAGGTDDPMQVDAATAAAGDSESTAATAAAPATEPAAAAAGEAAAGGDAAMQTEAPAAVAATPAAVGAAAGEGGVSPAAAGPAAAGGGGASGSADTEMATEETPVVTDHSQTNAVGGSS